MLSFIAQYWLTFIFGLIATGMGIVAKHFYNLYKKGKCSVEDEKTQEILDRAETMMNKKDKKIIEIMDTKHRNLANEDGKIFERLSQQEQLLQVLKKGILSIQGRQFKEDCRILIEQEELISLDQFTRLQEEHQVYNSLGGNHEGDMMFKLVEQKYLSQIAADGNK